MGDILNRSLLCKLEVLTDLVEFAERRIAVNSQHTSGWADPTTLVSWAERIGSIRNALPKDVLEEFDEERKGRGHRDGCECMLCEERRGNT